MRRRSSTTQSAALAACMVAALGLPGCGERAGVTVSEVRHDFANAAISGTGSASPLGSITADRWDAATGELLGVHVEMGDAFFLSAASAELIIDTQTDEMMIRFNDVIWTAPADSGAPTGTPVLGGTASQIEGRMFEAESRTTPPWSLGVDVVPDNPGVLPPLAGRLD